MNPLMTLLTPSVLRHSPDAPADAITLARLLEAGFNVPLFAVIRATDMALLRSETGDAQASMLAEEVKRHLPAKRYELRLTDSGLVSECAPDGLIAALRTMASASTGAVIVQEHIPAGIAGVTVTRDPSGEREMAVEERRGGPDGNVRRMRFLWNEHEPRTDLPDFGYAVREWKKTEELLGSPQEIEWRLWKKDWYLLRSRPITAFNAARSAQARYLDETLPARKAFRYEKSDLTELAPRPTPVTLDLLRRLHAAGGPVERAHARFNMRYRGGDFFVTVGNELFVDKEKELHTLLPAFSCLKPKNSGASFRSIRGLWTTMRNGAATQKLTPDREEEAIERELCALLKDRPSDGMPLRAALGRFLEQYETVAAVDICATKALLSLRRALGDESVHLAALLSAALVPDARATRDPLPPLPPPPAGMLGNTLELSDTSPFFGVLPAPGSAWELTSWWQGLSEERKAVLSPVIVSAQRWNALREMGRWLTIKLLQPVRAAVLRDPAVASLPDPTLAFFALLDELLSGRIPQTECHARRETFASLSGMHLPPILSDRPRLHTHLKPLCVSPGNASGTLVTEDALATVRGPAILCASTPSADLTRYLSRIGGIVCEHGDLLSYLAIIARERKIPMLVHVFPGDDLRPGDVVDLNASAGTIRVLKRE